MRVKRKPMDLAAMPLKATEFEASPVQIVDDDAAIGYGRGNDSVIVAMGPFHISHRKLILVSRGQCASTVMSRRVANNSIA